MTMTLAEAEARWAKGNPFAAAMIAGECVAAGLISCGPVLNALLAEAKRLYPTTPAARLRRDLAERMKWGAAPVHRELDLIERQIAKAIAPVLARRGDPKQAASDVNAGRLNPSQLADLIATETAWWMRLHSHLGEARRAR